MSKVPTFGSTLSTRHILQSRHPTNRLIASLRQPPGGPVTGNRTVRSDKNAQGHACLGGGGDVQGALARLRARIIGRKPSSLPVNIGEVRVGALVRFGGDTAPEKESLTKSEARLVAGTRNSRPDRLGQRFLGSNHIRQPRRACRTMYG
jgi:hypothetical protein